MWMVPNVSQRSLKLDSRYWHPHGQLKVCKNILCPYLKILHLSTFPLTSWGAQVSERIYCSRLSRLSGVAQTGRDWYLTFNGNAKRHTHSQLNWAILLCDVIPDGKTEYCAVLTGNSAGLRTVLSSRLSHRELLSSLRESHSFLSLPTDTTMASSQGNHLQHPFLENSFSRWASLDIHISFQIPLLTAHFTLSFLLFG